MNFLLTIIIYKHVDDVFLSPFRLKLLEIKAGVDGFMVYDLALIEPMQKVSIALELRLLSHTQVSVMAALLSVHTDPFPLSALSAPY